MSSSIGKHTPKIISFSGIDGAGKSTQISALDAWLAGTGLRTLTLTFWDNVVVFSRARELSSHRIFKGDSGIGSPDKPVHRRDKNVTFWPVTALRLCLYLADAASLCITIRQVRRSNADVVIFDRYIYDELANLPLQRFWARAFTRLILTLAPRPHVAYVIDADPVAALARKPEYPLEFLRRNRDAYVSLSLLDSSITLIEPLSVENTEAFVRQRLLAALSTRDNGLARLSAAHGAEKTVP